MDATSKKRFDVLRLDDVYFFVPALSHEGDGAKENAEYFYEERTCPTNITRTAEHIVWDGRADPHGVFEYVGTTGEIDWPNGTHTPETLLREAFPEAFAPADAEKAA